MSKGLVYLGGQVTGLDFGSSVAWPEQMREMIDERIDVVGPMRHQRALKHVGKIGSELITGNPTATDAAIRRGCKHDILRVDFCIFNLQPIQKLSLGCMWEMAWADMLQKPICVILTDNKFYDHPFIRDGATWLAPDSEKAAEIVNSFLLPSAS